MRRLLGVHSPDENPEHVNRSFEFEEPWETADSPDILKEQLESAISPGHPLYRQVQQVLAARVDSDDILVRTRSGFAMIHLSWCRRSQNNPTFPHFITFDSWEHFLNQVYQPEVEQWKIENPADDWQELLS